MNEYKILNVKINQISIAEAVEFVVDRIRHKKKTQIATVNNEFVVDAQKNHRFMEILNKADLCVADSSGIVWAVRKLFNVKIEKVPGVDLFLKICEKSSDLQIRLFFVGGENKAGSLAKQRLIRKYPGLHIVGVIEDMQINENKINGEIVDQINKAKPDIVFVALGAPKQEIWISTYKDLTNAHIFIGIGGTLDYISGNIKRAPEFMRKMSLEWLFRLFSQPRRITRIIKATLVFPYLINRSH